MFITRSLESVWKVAKVWFKEPNLSINQLDFGWKQKVLLDLLFQVLIYSPPAMAAASACSGTSPLTHLASVAVPL